MDSKVTQPEALRLADWLLDWLGNNVEPADLEAVCVKAAAELRRLHEANQELLEALKLALEAFQVIPEEVEGYLPEQCTDAVIATREAIAKHGGAA